MRKSGEHGWRWLTMTTTEKEASTRWQVLWSAISTSYHFPRYGETGDAEGCGWFPGASGLTHLRAPRGMRHLRYISSPRMFSEVSDDIAIWDYFFFCLRFIFGYVLAVTGNFCHSLELSSQIASRPRLHIWFYFIDFKLLHSQVFPASFKTTPCAISGKLESFLESTCSPSWKPIKVWGPNCDPLKIARLGYLMVSTICPPEKEKNFLISLL